MVETQEKLQISLAWFRKSFLFNNSVASWTSVKNYHLQHSVVTRLQDIRRDQDLLLSLDSSRKGLQPTFTYKVESWSSQWLIHSMWILSSQLDGLLGIYCLNLHPSLNEYRCSSTVMNASGMCKFFGLETHKSHNFWMWASSLLSNVFLDKNLGHEDLIESVPGHSSIINGSTLRYSRAQPRIANSPPAVIIQETLSAYFESNRSSGFVTSSFLAHSCG